MTTMIFATIYRDCDHNKAVDFATEFGDNPNDNDQAKAKLVQFLKTNQGFATQSLEDYYQGACQISPQSNDQCYMKEQRQDTINQIIKSIDRDQLALPICQFLEDGNCDEDGNIILSQIIIKKVTLS